MAKKKIRSARNNKYPEFFKIKFLVNTSKRIEKLFHKLFKSVYFK